MPDTNTINPTANVQPHGSQSFLGSFVTSRQTLDDDYTTEETTSLAGRVVLGLRPEFRNWGTEIGLRDMGFRTVKVYDSTPRGAPINPHAHPESYSGTFISYSHLSDRTKSEFWSSYLRYLNQTTNRTPIASMFAYGDLARSREAILEAENPYSTAQHGPPISTHDLPADANETPDVSPASTNAGSGIHWVNRVLVLGSIIAAVGIAAIYWGTSIESREVVFAGLLIFSTAVISWCVPFVAISYWLLRDGFRFVKKLRNKR